VPAWRDAGFGCAYREVHPKADDALVFHEDAHSPLILPFGLEGYAADSNAPSMMIARSPMTRINACSRSTPSTSLIATRATSR
jgi:hypothetical protein